MFQKVGIKTDRGLTLLEVLISFVLIASIAGLVLNFYVSQYRFTREVMVQAEWDYALLRAGQVVSSAVRVSEEVNWSGKQLRVTYRLDGKIYNDVYYLADKDHDGIQDLYREHLSVPNPVVSRLTSFNCIEIRKGLWKITLSSGEGEREVLWERTVHQKVDTD